MLENGLVGACKKTWKNQYRHTFFWFVAVACAAKSLIRREFSFVYFEPFYATPPPFCLYLLRACFSSLFRSCTGCGCPKRQEYNWYVLFKVISTLSYSVLPSSFNMTN